MADTHPYNVGSGPLCKTELAAQPLNRAIKPEASKPSKSPQPLGVFTFDCISIQEAFTLLAAPELLLRLREKVLWKAEAVAKQRKTQGGD